jgi:hypothetical protein
MHRLPAKSLMPAAGSRPSGAGSSSIGRHPAPKVTERTTLGGQMHALVERLYQLCRSITGNGVRATLDVLAESIPLTVHEIPTGTAVLDWTCPRDGIYPGRLCR